MDGWHARRVCVSSDEEGESPVAVGSGGALLSGGGLGLGRVARHADSFVRSTRHQTGDTEPIDPCKCAKKLAIIISFLGSGRRRPGLSALAPPHVRVPQLQLVSRRERRSAITRLPREGAAPRFGLRVHIGAHLFFFSFFYSAGRAVLTFSGSTRSQSMRAT